MSSVGDNIYKVRIWKERAEVGRDGQIERCCFG